MSLPPLCAGSGAAATVEQLLQMQADCRAADVIDRTPLHAAAAGGHRWEQRKGIPLLDAHASASHDMRLPAAYMVGACSRH